MSDARDARIRAWHDGPLPPGVAAAARRLAEAEGVRQVALMPDVHLAADVCVGTVVGTAGTLYPNAVGGDIGCGMAAVAFDADARTVDDADAAARVLTALSRAIPFVRHRRGTGGLPPELQDRPLSAPHLEALKKGDGSLQLGTLGSGNHFVELQEADDGRLWLMVHSGSRGLGQAVRDHHLARCRTGHGGLRFLEADSAPGRAYLDDVGWALDYAEASRRAMVAAVAEALSVTFAVAADEATLVTAHHNHVRQETHAGETLWVHRKGAIPAAVGERGLVPGSMGTFSVHVVGLGCADAMSSSAHGAGRRLARGEARRAISVRALGQALHGVWFDHRLAPHLRDEAPAAYKDLRRVLSAQRDLARVVRRLRPVLVYKGV